MNSDLISLRKQNLVLASGIDCHVLYVIEKLPHEEFGDLGSLPGLPLTSCVNLHKKVIDAFEWSISLI